LVEDVENVLETLSVPHEESCACGGSVLTPETDMEHNSYEVSWADKHSSPFEYGVFGWAKLHHD